ncbi:MAG: hypothetical protein ACREXS_13860 [Gammaproteobacteria bacterium]
MANGWSRPIVLKNSGGDWSFAWGAQEDADSIAAIRHALDGFPVSAASPPKI